MVIDAVLPASGRLPADFASEAGAEVKALIAFDGCTLLERAVRAVRRSGAIRQCIVVGPEVARDDPGAREADAFVAEGPTGTDNVYRGLAAAMSTGAPRPDRAIIVATDLPFITPASIRAYLEACPAGAELVAPIYTRETFDGAFPGSINTYVALTDGAWTLGCAFLARPQALLDARAHIDQVFEARKSQVRMALLLGLPFVARFLTHRLGSEHIESRCSSLLRCTAAAVRCAPPELAFDIDVPEAYRWAAAHQPSPLT